MAEYIEVLTHQVDAVAGDERYSFVVNTAVADVTLTAPVAVFPVLRAANDPAAGKFPYFQRRDNIRVLSVGLFLPYQFTVSTQCVHVDLSWEDVAGNLYPVFTDFANQSGLWVPWENYEMQVDRFAPFPTTAATKCRLLGILKDGASGPANDRLRVSMLNVPAALNGTTQYARLFVKVAHTLFMTA